HRRGLSERTRAARIEDRAHDATTRPRQARLDRRGPRPCGRPRPEEEVSNGRQDPEGVQELFRDHGRGQVPPVRRRDVEGLARLRDHRRPPAVRNREEDPELRDALQRIGSVVMRVTNPAGTITPDAWRVISEAFKSKERVRVEVRGEEDLLALVCIALAPSSAAVLYGLPSQGVVVVRPDEAAKSRALDVLRRMER